ncbi:MAG: DUF962 domain-containing protein [Myxococcota bacterium]|nr:DUF962 domain-containing protein [Myxococcota bacterium]
MSNVTPNHSERYQSFPEFWPFYVGEHRDPRNRALHYLGTTGVIGLMIAAIVVGPWWLATLLPVCGYGFAWFGHFVIERNRPATFLYPRWSLLADFKMYGLAITGRMRGEVIRLYGSPHPPPEAPLLSADGSHQH